MLSEGNYYFLDWEKSRRTSVTYDFFEFLASFQNSLNEFLNRHQAPVLTTSINYSDPIQDLIADFYKQLCNIFNVHGIDPMSLFSIFLAEKTLYLLGDHEPSKVIRLQRMQKRRITPLVRKLASYDMRPSN